MTRSLPANPSLEYLKKEAKDIHRAHRSGESEACAVLQYHPRFRDETETTILAAAVTLQEVQHALSRSYGYEDWVSLVRSIEPTEVREKIRDTRVNFLDERSGSPAGDGLLGIDIGSSCIKLVELIREAGESGELQVQTYGVEPLISAAVEETNIKDVGAVVAALRRLVARCQPVSRRASLATAGSAIITKLIRMPASLSDDELEREIYLGSDQWIPYPIREVSLAYEVKGTVPGDPEQLSVLLSACRKANTDVRRKVLEQAGLIPSVIDIEAHCIDRAFRRTDPEFDDVVAIIGIGSTLTRLSVLLKHGGTPYTREQLFGVRQLTNEIQRRYRVTFEQAEAAVRHQDTDYLESYEEEVYQPFLDACTQQIRRSIEFFLLASTCEAVDRIILAGGGASLPGLVAKVSAEMAVDVRLADPLDGISCSAAVDVEALHTDAPALMIASGLALLGVTGQAGDTGTVGRNRTVRVPDDLEEEMERRRQQAVSPFVHKMLSDAINDAAEEIHFHRKDGSLEVLFEKADQITPVARPPGDMTQDILETLFALFAADSVQGSRLDYETDEGNEAQLTISDATPDTMAIRISARTSRNR